MLNALRILSLAPLLVGACNSDGLSPGAAPDGGGHRAPDLARACSSAQDEADCDARPDCYSLYSGDLPCNSSGCSNHFERCLDGATAPCTPPSGGGGDSCTQLTPKCASGDSTDYLANGCSGGCVHSSRCAK